MTMSASSSRHNSATQVDVQSPLIHKQIPLTQPINEIPVTPSQLPPPPNPFDNNQVLISSILYKRSPNTRQWKKKWVVLRKYQLSYYKDSREYKPDKVYNYHNLLSYNIIPDQNKNHFAIYTHKKTLHFKTDNDKVFNEWRMCLEQFFHDKDTQQGGIDHEEELMADDEQEGGDYQEEPEQIQQFAVTAEEIQPEPETPAMRPKLEMKTTSSEANMNIFKGMPSAVEYSGAEEFSLSEGGYGNTGGGGISDVAPAPINTVISPQIGEVLTTQDEHDLETTASHPPAPPKSQNRKGSSSSIQEYVVEQGYVQLLRHNSRFQHHWNRVWLVLTNQQLAFYKSKLDVSNNTIPPFRYFHVGDIHDVIELEAMSRTKQWCLLIITPLKRLRICCASEEDMAKWFSGLKAISVTNRRLSQVAL